MSKRICRCKIITVALAALILLPFAQGCGDNHRVQAAGGDPNGNISAVVKLQGRANGRMAAQSATSTVTVSLFVSGCYGPTGVPFATVTTTVTFSLSQGSVTASILSVPVGVNHVLTAVADWGTASETVKAIIPKVESGVTTTVTADEESTVVADTAIYLAEEQNESLDDMDDTDIKNIEGAVASMAANGIPYSDMTPAQVLNYLVGMSVPTAVTITPASATVIIGQTYQFSGALLDLNHIPITGATFTWSFSSSAGTISSSGLFTAMSPGSGVVTVTSGAFTAVSSVTVAATCSQDSQCDDGNALTSDTCTNAGAQNAACVHGPAERVLSIGGDHACAVQADSTVKCWGLNNNGQIGNGMNNTPMGGGLKVRVGRDAVGGGKAARAAIRGERTAAPRAAAVAVAYAYDLLVLQPTTVVNLSGAKQVAARGMYTCALINDGTEKCWGSNSYGQLGNGTTTDSNVPTPVSGLSGVVQIENSYQYACAVINDGTVKCWGSNSYGRLGDGTTTDSYVPVAVTGLTGATAIALADYHACALLQDGTVKCWGTGFNGQLGDGTTTDSSVPVSVSGLTGVIAIAAGGGHTCALLQGGAVKCWGGQGAGELGDGLGSSAASVPVSVSGLTGATAISLGDYHSCALLSGGQAKCWGLNHYLELGSNLNETEPVPATVTAVQGSVAAISAGGDATCFQLTSGALNCVGWGYYGQLGDGKAWYNTTPRPEIAMSGVAHVAMGLYTACASNGSGATECWGINSNGQLGDGTTLSRITPVVVQGIASPIGLATGSNHTCALLPDGTAKCWGYNAWGALGDGTYNDSLSPVSVSGLTGATAISALSNFNCALMTGGSVQCWGQGDNGQLGNGGNVTANSPVSVSGLSGATSITAGAGYVCVIMSDTTVQCWGDNSYGELGDGSYTSSSTPVAVSGLSGATSLTASMSHVCAVVSGGGVKCWGRNNIGQLGDGTTADSSLPVSVQGLAGATSVTTGYDFSCALINNGTVKCWGDNSAGMLGDGTTTSSPTPVTVTGITDATAIYSGLYRTCALTSSNGLVCWGADLYYMGNSLI